MRKFFTLAMMLISLGITAQQMMIYQPSGGLNDGTDEGGINSGKDSWTNRFSPTTNYGDIQYTAGSPRSDCNTSDYKAYFQFDLTGLPMVIDSVFFGVTHAPDTDYCFSNCMADFCFYYVTEAWSENTINQTIEPAEDRAFYGPRSIAFPNNFGTVEYDITNAYTYWINNPQDNYGFTVYSPIIGCNNAAVLFNVHTSDDVDSTLRPYLRIYYNNISTEEHSVETTVVYPNPCMDRLKIKADEFKFLSCYDLTGRTVSLPYLSSDEAFDTSELPGGIYFMKIETSGTIQTLRFIKRE